MALKLSALTLLGMLLAAVALVPALFAAAHPAGAAVGGWTGKYYNNMTFSGTPALTRDEGPYLDFYRDGDEPGPGVNIEEFSVRWTRADDYAADTYRIIAAADDGITVFVDGVEVIDAWFDQEITSYTVDVYLTAGSHRVRVDYYNNLGKAAASVWIVPLGVPAEPTPVLATAEAPVPTDVPQETASAPSGTGTAVPVGTIAPTRTIAALSTTERTTTAAASTQAPSSTASPTSTPGIPPRLECLWALPDMNSSVAGIQYDTQPATGSHDDDAQAVPDRDNDASNGVQEPCAGPPGAAASQPDGVRHLMQVVPNLEDQPERRRVQLWSSIDVTESVGEPAVFWYVYYPDGSAAGGVASTRVLVDDCGLLGGPLAGGSMFAAAIANGEVGTPAVLDPDLGMIARCQRHQTRLFHGEFELSKDQPCGEYTVSVAAVSSDGAVSVLTGSFDVLCTIALRVDFNMVDWGSLTPGNAKTIYGDDVFEPPASAAPTVKNVGNDGMGFKLRFGPMIGASTGATIDMFGACFGRAGSPLQCIDPIAVNTLKTFDPVSPQTLCANETGEADLSIHPPSDALTDVYRGVLTIIGYHVPGLCAGNRHIP